MAISLLAGAALAIGAGVASSAVSGGFSALAQAQAFKNQKEILKNQIQWKVNDLEGAGLNKYLAVSGGIGGGGGASVPQAATPDFSKAVTSAKEVSKLSDEKKILRENVKTATNTAETSRHITMKTIAESSTAEDVALQARMTTLLQQEQRGRQTAVEGVKNRLIGAGARTVNQAMDAFGLESKMKSAAQRKPQ